mmetsp:Transcript_24876/g.73107  ORF Transcript_24876/g.73107 Transcript_24876/m.73107 type:complete len:301 (-) Transcript_24876:505-1407(-)
MTLKAMPRAHLILRLVAARCHDTGGRMPMAVRGRRISSARGLHGKKTREALGPEFVRAAQIERVQEARERLDDAAAAVAVRTARDARVTRHRLLEALLPSDLARRLARGSHFRRRDCLQAAVHRRRVVLPSDPPPRLVEWRRRGGRVQNSVSAQNGRGRERGLLGPSPGGMVAQAGDSEHLRCSRSCIRIGAQEGVEEGVHVGASALRGSREVGCWRPAADAVSEVEERSRELRERGVEGDHLCKNAAEGPHVCAGPESFAADALGAEVFRCADARKRAFGYEGLAPQSKVTETNVPICR